MIVILAGLPGTGKSTIARALAERLPGVVLDKDLIRAALFPPSHVEYSVEQDDFCQEVMLETTGYLLRRERSLYVLLDGRTFSRRYQRKRVINFSAGIGTPWAMLECVCTEAAAVQRLTRAAVERTHPAANRTPELYYQIQAAWEPIEGPKLIVNTEGGLDACAGGALSYIIDRNL
jgi:predicted kinase